MRTFNDFDVIRQELAQRLAAKDAEARETGNYSPNVVRMSGMINMQQIRTASERLEDRMNQRKVEATRKLVRLSSIESRDQQRREMLAAMFADDLGLEDYGDEDLGDEDLGDESGETDLFEDLLARMQRDEPEPPADEELPPLATDMGEAGFEFGPGEEGAEGYQDEIDRILQRARGGIR